MSKNLIGTRRSLLNILLCKCLAASTATLKYIKALRRPKMNTDAMIPEKTYTLKSVWLSGIVMFVTLIPWDLRMSSCSIISPLLSSLLALCNYWRKYGKISFQEFMGHQTKLSIKDLFQEIRTRCKLQKRLIIFIPWSLIYIQLRYIIIHFVIHIINLSFQDFL